MFLIGKLKSKKLFALTSNIVEGFSMTKVCLFLGAGASKAIGGYPTTKEFMHSLEGYLGKSEKEALQVICKRSNVEDIENVLEIIDPIVKSRNSELNNAIDRLGINVNSDNTIIRWKNFSKSCVLLKQKIIENLHREYSFHSYKVKSNYGIYLNFFSIIRDHLNGAENDKYFNFLNIFTTNYDRIIEELPKERIRTYDFFVFNQDVQRYFFDPHNFGRLQSQLDRVCLKLFKLHGSLD